MRVPLLGGVPDKLASLSSDKAYALMIRYHMIDGALRPAQEASIHVTDLGLLRGYAIFDYLLVRQGQPLFLDDYLSRLLRSAELLRLSLPFSREQLRRQVTELVRANALREGGIRFLVTGGPSPDGYSPSSTPTVLILAHPMPRFDPQVYTRGLKLLLHLYRRDIPEVKTTNYLIGIHQLPRLRAAGASEVLYHDGTYIYETTRSNFFIVKKDGTVVTPAEGVLQGITRKHVIQLAREAFEVELRPLALGELAEAAEAFVTSTIKRVAPVVQVADVVIGEGRPGPVAKRLREMLVELEAQYIAEAALSS